MSQALAEAGADAIALLDRRQELGTSAATELHETAGIPVQFHNVDVRDEKAVAEAVGKIVEELGSVDIVINSAGIVEYVRFKQKPYLPYFVKGVSFSLFKHLSNHPSITFIHSFVPCTRLEIDPTLTKPPPTKKNSSNIKAETYDATMFRTLLDINLTGSFLVSQACARHMIAARTGGSILFLSSIAGMRVLHPQQQCAYK